MTINSEAMPATEIRPTSGNRLLPLDGWRGVACLSVFITHTGFFLHSPPLVWFGWSGVHLFFVLSGYLIGKPFITSLALNNHPFPRIRGYFVRRLFRIYPAYFVSVAVFYMLRLLTHTKPPSAVDLLSRICLYFNYVRRIDLYSFNAVYWTLAIEAQFYVLVPLLAFPLYLTRGRRRLVTAFTYVGIFLFVCIVSRALEVHADAWAYPGNSVVRFRTVFSFLDLFGLGMLVALIQCVPGIRHLFNSANLVLASLVGLTLFLTANNWLYSAGQTAWNAGGSSTLVVCFPVLLSAGVALILLPLILNSRDRQLPWDWKPLAWVGEISYSFYLYHLAVLTIVYRVAPLTSVHNRAINSLCHIAIGLPPTLLVSWLMYLLVERPSLRMAAHFRGTPAALAPQP